tara:strand:- start:352 stop:3711 length:3360 start_codon:yes stop_codon:yes gene_type:complete
MAQDNLRSDAPAALPRIPGFRIEGILGRGATGVVYGAVQIAVDRPVAIKILHPELTGNRRAARRLQREARTAARLGHPGIISAIDMGEVEGRWWYAMELVEGINLAERIQERGAMSEREALRVFAPLVDALQHASEMGVVHRDIKPGNVLIDPTGRARLVDLGLAFAEDDPRMTRSGGTLGTPHYISPEQARDPGSADSRSDIWSLGATLYHALVGKPPFEGTSVAEILSSVLYQPIGDPRREAPHLSKGMALVLRKCMSRDPERRYQSPEDLGADLERLRERRAPTVRASTLEPVADGRPAWLAPAVWTLIIVGAASVGYYLRESTRVPDPGRSNVEARSTVLENLLPSLEAGRMTLAQAFHSHQFLISDDASAPLPTDLRPEADRVRLKLEASLEAALDELTVQITSDFEQDLLAGDLQAAKTRLERDLGSRLESATAFRSLESLPVGPSRQKMTAFRDNLQVRLDRARMEGIDDAIQMLRLHYRESIASVAMDQAKQNRFRDALTTLASSPESWDTELVSELDRFEGADRRAILNDSSLLDEIARDVAEVDRMWEGVDGRLRAFVGEQSRLLESRLESGGSGAAGALMAAWTQRVEDLGLTVEQLPVGAVWRSERDLQVAHANLEDREEEITEETARALFLDDRARADAMCADRQYERAREMWDEGLASSWRDAVKRRMQRGRMESDLLAGFLDDAVAGLQTLDGEHTEFEVGGIVRRGTVSGTTSDPGQRQFSLRETGTGRVQLLALRSSAFTKKAELVVPKDMEALAEIARPSGSDDVRKLTIALFRFHEGDVAGAKAILPPVPALAEYSEVHFDLLSRIEASLEGAASAQRERQQEKDELIRGIAKDVADGKLFPQSLIQKINRVLEDHYDTISAEERAGLVNMKAELIRATPRLTAEDAYPGAIVVRGERDRLQSVHWNFDGSMQGWKSSRWLHDLGTLSLQRAPESQTDLLDRRMAAVVSADPVLATQDKMTVTFTFDLDEASPPITDLFVTAGGLAFLFVNEADDPRMLVGAGLWADLLAKARKGGELSTSNYHGFLRTQPNVLRIVFGPKNRSRAMPRQVEVWLNDRELPVRIQGGASASPMEPGQIAFRSYQPLRLLDVLFEGNESRR